MRRLAVFLATIACLAGPSRAADRGDEPSCLSSGESSEAVSSQRVVAPREALLVARKAVPNGEVLRAVLCRQPDLLVYVIMLLRKDGRLVRVTVDAPAGKVLLVH